MGSYSFSLTREGRLESSRASASRTLDGEKSSGESGSFKLPRLLQVILCGIKEGAKQLEGNRGLSQWNKYITKKSCKREMAEMVLQLADLFYLIDAYFNILMAKQYKRYLQFVFSVHSSSEETVRVCQRLLQHDLLQLGFHSATQDHASPVPARLADQGQGPGTALVVELTGRLCAWLNDRNQS